MPPHMRKDSEPVAAEEAVPATDNGPRPDDSPKMMAIKAMIEAAENRIRSRIDSINKDLNERQAALSEALGDVTGGQGGTLAAEVAQASDLHQRLNEMASELSDLSTGFVAINHDVGEFRQAQAEGNRMVTQAVASILDRLHAVEDAARQNEVTLEALGTEVEECSAAIEDDYGRNTVDGNGVPTPTLPAGSGQVCPPAAQRHVLSAIWQVMRDVEGIGKHGQMKQGDRYNYRQYDDMAEEIGRSFRRHGVMIQSRVTDRQYHHRAIKDGAQEWTSAYLTVVYRFTSLVDGTEVEFESQGEGRDLTDKATRKAMTMALKAALDQAFLLGNDDPDPDSVRPDSDDVEPNVRVPENETPAAKAAREAYEAKRATARRTEQDTAAETPPAEPAREPIASMSADSVQAEIDRAKAEGRDPAAAGVQAIMDRMDATPVEDAQPVEQPRDPWDVPPGSTETTLAAQQNAALEAADEADINRKKAARAVQAYQAASGPGMTLDKLNGIIAQATKEDLMRVELEVKGEQKPLRSWLIALGRTVAP